MAEIPGGNKPVRVPLVIYIGGERRIVGSAVVTGKEVECHINPDVNSDILADLIKKEVIKNVSISFNAIPAIDWEVFDEQKPGG